MPWSTDQLLRLFLGLYGLLAWALLSIIHTDGQQRRGFTVNLTSSHKAIKPLIYSINDTYIYMYLHARTDCSRINELL